MQPSALLTDFYQLTMLQGYFAQRMEATAVFEFFVRRLPPNRGFLLFAGLEQMVEYLEGLRFSEADLAWLQECGRFNPEFVEWLGGLRFTGDVDAMPEGTVFFPSEPVVRVTAPLPEAQLIESRLINLVNFQTVIASKAARCVLVAKGKPLIDFGLRRAHGAEAGVLAARAAYLAGFSGTATVLAGSLFGIPVYGTMAHSFIQAHETEIAAFEHFAHTQPDNVVLLLDTFDTESAARGVVQLAARLKERDIAVRAVRLDSGDLARHARRVRSILDKGGLAHVKILASGNLDEYAVRDLVSTDAPIDKFAIGTQLTTSADAPALDSVYKLQEYAGKPSLKRSEGKATWPGRKQVFRKRDTAGRIASDVITLSDDAQAGLPLLQPVMRGGRRVGQPTALADLRQCVSEELARLPKPLQKLEGGRGIPVTINQSLVDLAQSLGPTRRGGDRRRGRRQTQGHRK